MPGLPEDTASLAQKLYHLVQVFRPALVVRLGWLVGEGGCQRGAGKMTSSGIRGGEDKSIRRLAPFGDCFLPLQPPCHVSIFKNPRKIGSFLSNRCQSVNKRRHPVSTADDTIFTCWRDPLFSITSAPRFPSDPWIGTALHRRPRLSRRCRGAPMKHRRQTLSETPPP